MLSEHSAHELRMLLTISTLPSPRVISLSVFLADKLEHLDLQIIETFNPFVF